MASVVATYASGRGEVVTLECYCGDYWPQGNAGSDATEAKVKARMDAIEQAGRQLGCDVRAGVLEP